MILLILAVRMRSDAMKTFLINMVLIPMVLFTWTSMLFKMEIGLNESIQSSLEMKRHNDSEGTESSIKHIMVSHFLHWFSLDLNQDNTDDILIYFFFIVALIMYKGIKLYQEMRRSRQGLEKATPKVVFENISRLNADESLINLFKFLVNYGFYKFGIEISFVLFVVVIFIRLNSISIVYLFLFIMLVLRYRESMENLWRAATSTITILLILQCLFLAFFIIIQDLDTLVTESTYQTLKFLFDNLQKLYRHPTLLVADLVLLISMTCQVRNNFHFTASIYQLFSSFQYSENKSSGMILTFLEAGDVTSQFYER